MPKNLFIVLLLLGALLPGAGVARAETEIVPYDKKPGQGYKVDPKDEAANRAICGTRCDERDSSRQGFITNGGWRPKQEYPDAAKVFIVYEYNFDYEHNPDAPPQAQAICGSRCNAMSDNLKSFQSPNTQNLIKIPGRKTKVIELDGPSVKGKCFCRGDEYYIDPDPAFGKY